MFILLPFLLAPTTTFQQPTAQEFLVFPAGEGVHEAFLVLNPDASSSPASKPDLEREGKEGAPGPPTPGFLLHSRVVVETPDFALLTEFSRSVDADAILDPFHEVEGFSLVELPTIRRAVEMALALEALFGEGMAYLDADRPKFLRYLPSDPQFGQQWHLRNTSNQAADINAEPAWTAGWTGNGSVVGILEWGVQDSHPDLSANFNSAASENAGTSGHGTACAGVAAADNDNGRGGVGLAFDAQWSEQLAGSSSRTASAFKYRNDLNDVKSNSWGPSDNGDFHTFSTTERNALRDSTSTGRGGLGEIFTWAAGNGGLGDRVEYDPYAASRYTIAVGAVGDQDTRSYYNEQGSSMFVVTQSDGNNRGIYTTYSGSSYTSNFGGTSSASPLGAGAVALILDANPNLGWRDVQHVLAHSSRKIDSTDNRWVLNGAGHDINYYYGFGAIDVYEACLLASSWTNVSPVQEWTSGNVSVNQSIPDNSNTGITKTVTVDTDFKVEHVELVMDVDHNTLGDLRIAVTSPAGTISVVAKTGGSTQNNLNNYLFTSIRHWDEDSRGDWVVNISDRDSGTTGTFNLFQLKLYGNDGGHMGGFQISTPGLTSGQVSTVSVTGANPTSPTFLGYSVTGAGSTPIPGLGVTLGLDSPRQAGGMKLTDSNGATSWSLPIPAAAAGIDVWVQSAQQGLASNVLALTVQ